MYVCIYLFSVYMYLIYLTCKSWYKIIDFFTFQVLKECVFIKHVFIGLFFLFECVYSSFKIRSDCVIESDCVGESHIFRVLLTAYLQSIKTQWKFSFYVGIEDIVIPPPPVATLSHDVPDKRLIITQLKIKNFKSYAGEVVLGPFNKVVW